LLDLSIAHIDCDAFYASVEKRDDPSLADRPVIIGGGRRGVVAACCYVARLYGVRSAMPMFKALKACPDAVVIRPDMEKYGRIGRSIREAMRSVTPLVEPVSIDEAFLDLSGTVRLHHGSPAETLARLARRIEDQFCLTVSIGLSYNKFLAKIASDLDKPRGFAVVGRTEALDFLAEKPVSLLWGVGDALRRRLNRDGIEQIAHLRQFSETDLVARYGRIGHRLFAFALGHDEREIVSYSEAKSISAETTFDDDIADLDELRRQLWRLSEKVARRLKTSGLAAGSVTLKLRTDDFRIRTRSRRLSAPSQLAERLFGEGEALLSAEVDGKTTFRLIGIGGHDLHTAGIEDGGDLLDGPRDRRQREIEAAMDQVRQRLGDDSIVKGRAFLPRPPRKGRR